MYRNRRILSMVVSIITSMIFLGGGCAAIEDFGKYIEGFKNKMEVDLEVVGMGSAGVKLEMSLMFYDENGLPANISDTVIMIDTVLVGGNPYDTKYSADEVYIAKTIINRGDLGVFPQTKEFPGDRKIALNEKTVIVPVKKDTGIIEFREMKAQQLNLEIKLRKFVNSRSQTFTERWGNDHASVLVMVAKRNGDVLYFVKEFFDVI